MEPDREETKTTNDGRLANSVAPPAKPQPQAIPMRVFGMIEGSDFIQCREAKKLSRTAAYLRKEHATHHSSAVPGALSSERNHQSLDSKIIQLGDETGRHEGDVQSRERLGGMLRYYYRKAAWQSTRQGVLRLAGRLRVWPNPLASSPLTAVLTAMFGRDSWSGKRRRPDSQRICRLTEKVDLTGFTPPLPVR